MPGSATNSFTEAAEYQASLDDLFAEFVVTQPGAFSARMTRASLHHLHLLRAQELVSRVAYVALPPELVFISFSSVPHRPLIWRGVVLQPGEIMVHSRGEQLHQRTLGVSCWGAISLPSASLAVFSKAFTGLAMAAPRYSQILRPVASRQGELLRLHAAAAKLAETRPQVLDRGEAARAMEHELAEALVMCLSEAEIREVPVSARNALEVMVRFEALLASRPRQTLLVPKISAAIGVSDRTFRNFCSVCLGVGPRQYLQLRRLQFVRAAILRADPATARIAEIATEGGFTDLGRFASLYRGAFGETPSTTLRRVNDP